MDVPFIEQVRRSWVDLNRSSHWLPRRGANHATAPIVAIPRPSMSTMATVGQVVAEASPLDAHLDGCFGSFATDRCAIKSLHVRNAPKATVGRQSVVRRDESFATHRCAMKIGPCPQCPESDDGRSRCCPVAMGHLQTHALQKNDDAPSACSRR